ncbi:MAG: hypothetical protein FD160_3761, partial [Caulobacteraceae bacterium]
DRVTSLAEQVQAQGAEIEELRRRVAELEPKPRPVLTPEQEAEDKAERLRLWEASAPQRAESDRRMGQWAADRSAALDARIKAIVAQELRQLRTPGGEA